MTKSQRKTAGWLLFVFALAAIAVTLLTNINFTSAPIISPLPKSVGASTSTQISVLGIAPKKIVSVTVSGSKSRIHSGQLRPYSDRSGASFLPAKPFDPGETVKVTIKYKNGLRTSNATSDFRIGRPANPFQFDAHVHPKATGGKRYVSNPEVQPVDVRMTKSGDVAPGYILLTASTVGPGKYGWSGPLMIDGNGDPVFTIKSPKGEGVNDFNIQRYRGQPVLTWWHGRVKKGVGVGLHEIFNSSYQRVAQVKAGNGYSADLHDFVITPRNSAFITAYPPVTADLTSVGGPKDNVVADSVVQEIDIPTGLVKFEWHALGHLSFEDSFREISQPWDPFHINSVYETQDRNLILSFRNTSAIYEIDHRTGGLKWTLGGKHSSFKLGPGVTFSYQHDARFVSDNPAMLSLFDNRNSADPIANSRAQIVRLDYKRRIATLANEYALERAPADSQGNTQLLPDGNVFVGWGSWPAFSEFTRSGKLVLTGKMVGAQSYRAHLAPWIGKPSYPPNIAVRRQANTVRVYASWNGATEVASWRVLMGDKADALSPVGRAKRTGFETVIDVPAGASSYAVEALSSSGDVLGTSSLVKL